jgi:hypothetical protein
LSTPSQFPRAAHLSKKSDRAVFAARSFCVDI